MEERNELCQALAQAEAVCGMESLLGLVFFWEGVGSSSCKNKENTEDYQTCFKLRHKVADGALEPDWAQRGQVEKLKTSTSAQHQQPTYKQLGAISSKCACQSMDQGLVRGHGWTWWVP